jgi:hypothetical protein
MGYALAFIVVAASLALQALTLRCPRARCRRRSPQWRSPSRSSGTVLFAIVLLVFRRRRSPAGIATSTATSRAREAYDRARLDSLLDG